MHSPINLQKYGMPTPLEMDRKRQTPFYSNKRIPMGSNLRDLGNNMYRTPRGTGPVNLVYQDYDPEDLYRKYVRSLLHSSM